MSERLPTDTVQEDVQGSPSTPLLLSPSRFQNMANDGPASPGASQVLSPNLAQNDDSGFSSNMSELPSPPSPTTTLTTSPSFTPSAQYVYPIDPPLIDPSLNPTPQRIQAASPTYDYFIPSQSALGRPQNTSSHEEDGQAGYIPGDSNHDTRPQPPHNSSYFFTPTPVYQPSVHVHQNQGSTPLAPLGGTHIVPKQQTTSQKSPGVTIVHADDYEQRYPEDPPGSECGPMARIWRIFLDECQEFDAGRIEILRDSVDVLLVFAGLFSAAVTTFVAQTSQSLQTDYTRISASLLYESVSIQRAVASGVAVSSIPVSPLNPTTTFVASTSDRWVNGLWFTSLSLSLITALVAVLAKQWMRQHMLASSGTPRDRARIRQFRYMGFEAWHVPIIIGILPSLLHISLTIFLAGLVVFLMVLERPIAYVILTLTGGSSALYVIAMFLPVFYPQCPYRTPLTDLVFIACKELLRWTLKERYIQPYPPSVRELELQSIESQSDSLDVQSLRWLYTISSNPTVHSCVIQSIGGLQVSINSEELDTSFKGSGIQEKQQELLQECLQPCIDRRYSVLVEGMDTSVERLLRSRLRLSVAMRQSHNSSVPRLLLTPTSHSPGHSSEAIALTAAIACHNDVHPPEHPSGADLFLHLTKQPQPNSIALHPLLWKSLFSDMISNHLFDPLDSSSHNHAFEEFCSSFMRIIARRGILWNASQPQDDGTRTVNLQNASYFGLYNVIEEQLLSALARFDEHQNDTAMSRHIRLLLAIMNYTLSTRSFPAVHWSDPDPPNECFCGRCLGMLFFAVHDLRICIKDYAPLSSRESNAICSTIEGLVMSQSFASKYKPWSHVLWVMRSDVVRILVRMTITQVYNPQSSAHNLSWPILPSQWTKFRDVICRLSFHQSSLDDLPQDMYARAKCVVEMGGLLADDINRGDATALDTFMDLDILGFIGRTMYMFPWLRIIQAYISAVSHKLESNNAVSESSDAHADLNSYHINAHLNCIHHPENLPTVCVILGGRLAGSPDQSGDGSAQITLLKLAGLRSLDSAWPSCIKHLDKLSQDELFLREQRLLTLKDDIKEARWKTYKDHEVQLIMVRLEESVATLRNYFIQHSTTA